METKEDTFREIAGIPADYKSFAYRYFRNIFGFLVLFSFVSLIVFANGGVNSITLTLMGSVFALVFLYGLRMSANILYKISVNEEGEIRVETMRYNKITAIVRNRSDLQVKVIQDATSRYIIDMIRIDVDRKTYFVQKQFRPWTVEKIQQVKELVKEKAL
ncbi:hypothetical protein [Chitinophaga caseinilytica]|uniref:Uncharacterized protein n=1 Tax=Chitinophaga caseinilytica TaxID=2267521 RepID=A0ABZ2YWP7_9BACT